MPEFTKNLSEKDQFGSDIAFIESLIKKEKNTNDLLGYTIDDFKSDKAKKIVYAHLNSKDRVKSNDMLLDLNNLLAKLKEGDGDNEDFKKAINLDLIKDIGLKGSVALSDISFKQAIQEYRRHREAYIKEDSSNRLKKSMLYLNVMMKKAKSYEEKKNVNEEIKNLNDLLKKNDLYKDLRLEGLKDLDNVSLQFHLAEYEYDRLFKLGDLKSAQSILKLMMKSANNKTEEGIVMDIVKNNLKRTKESFKDQHGKDVRNLEKFLLENNIFARTMGLGLTDVFNDLETNSEFFQAKNEYMRHMRAGRIPEANKFLEKMKEVAQSDEEKDYIANL